MLLLSKTCCLKFSPWDMQQELGVICFERIWLLMTGRGVLWTAVKPLRSSPVWAECITAQEARWESHCYNMGIKVDDVIVLYFILVWIRGLQVQNSTQVLCSHCCFDNKQYLHVSPPPPGWLTFMHMIAHHGSWQRVTANCVFNVYVIHMNYGEQVIVMHPDYF